MTKDPQLKRAAVACLASVVLNCLPVAGALVPALPQAAAKVLDALGRPGVMFSQGWWVHDIVGLLFGSFLFYFAAFWIVLAGWAAARGRRVTRL
jgi:hypothetical protein